MLTAVIALLFAPFYVGPVSHAPNAVHYTEYADSPAQGRMACLADWYWNGPGPMDCQVQPSSMAPNPTLPGWAW